jgi:hypothetical protein
MNQQPHVQQPHDATDADFHKGAVETTSEDTEDFHAPGLDERGLPNDEVAIAQDVLGANEDQTQG